MTGRGHHRIEALFQTGCAERGRKFSRYDEKAPGQRIAMWPCCHASSFVLIDTRPRSTVIGFEREEDADASGRELCLSKSRKDPEPGPVRFYRMSDEARRFRDRAKGCRALAESTRDDNWRKTLLNLAEAFEEEASRIEAEERADS